MEKNSRRRKDDGRRRVEKRKSLPLLSKNIFPRRGLETSKREKQKLSYNFVRQACVYFEQFGCVILLNNKQWEKRLRGRRGFTRFTGSEVFGKSAFFTLRLKSTNWIKTRIHGNVLGEHDAAYFGNRLGTTKRDSFEKAGKRSSFESGNRCE